MVQSLNSQFPLHLCKMWEFLPFLVEEIEAKITKVTCARWDNKSGVDPGVCHFRKSCANLHDHILLFSSQKPNAHFPICSAVIGGAAGKAGVSRWPANKEVPSRYLLGAGLLLVFVKHPLESHRSLKGNLWNIKPWVSRWASQCNLFCTYWVVRSGKFRSCDNNGKDTKSIPFSPRKLIFLDHRLY